MARTPGRIAGLTPGRHRVSITLPGYAPIEDIVDISDDDEEEFEDIPEDEADERDAEE